MKAKKELKAQKLPSGSYRVQVNLGKDPVTGKTIRRSVTAPTRQEAIRQAAMICDNTPDGELRVADACRRFLDTRGPELSPSTLRGYMATFSKYVEPDRIAIMKLSDLKTSTLQEWVGRFPKLSDHPETMSSKTKKNHLGFLTAVVSYFIEDKTFHVKIRETEQEEMYTPTPDEVSRVLAVADPVLQRAIHLGSLGMRRGEICALDAADVDREKCLVRINKALAKSPSGEWVTKMPKTKSSVRWIPLPKEVIDLLPTEGRVVPVSPDVITLRFIKAIQRAGVPHFRFHDLRAYFASISVSSAIGASELTVQQIGGWKTNNVLRKHYERSISEQRQKDTDKILDFYSANTIQKAVK